MDVRTFAADGPHRAGQHAGMDGVVDVADAQAAFLAPAQSLAQRLQAFGVLEQAAGFGQEGAAVGGQVQALIAPLEQGKAQVVFELGDLPAKGIVKCVAARPRVQRSRIRRQRRSSATDVDLA